MEDKSDFELLHAWRTGDLKAGDALFRRHFRAIYRFFRNKVDQEVEDLVQRTFTACVSGRDRFRGESTLRTYLFGIAHSLLRDHFRRRRPEAADDHDALSIVDMGASPVSVAAERGEKKLLLQALRRIPLESQVILEAVFWEEWSGAQLAEFLRISVEAARTRLRRAKQQLEVELNKLHASPNLITTTLSDLDEWAKRLQRRHR